MNENINLCKILKDCPRGTKLYSTFYGEVSFYEVNDSTLDHEYIVVYHTYGRAEFNKRGIHLDFSGGECTLFPSKDQRDWSKFKCSKPKFDPKTLQPFDRVLCRQNTTNWQCNMFSHTVADWKKSTYPFHCFSNVFRYTIPYNDDTKHLVGTSDEAPEFYRYWED